MKPLLYNPDSLATSVWLISSVVKLNLYFLALTEYSSALPLWNFAAMFIKLIVCEFDVPRFC